MADVRNFFKLSRPVEDTDRATASETMARDVATWQAAGGRIEKLDPAARSQPIFVPKVARGAAQAKAQAKNKRLLDAAAKVLVAEALELNQFKEELD